VNKAEEVHLHPPHCGRCWCSFCSTLCTQCTLLINTSEQGSIIAALEPRLWWRSIMAVCRRQQTTGSAMASPHALINIYPPRALCIKCCYIVIIAFFLCTIVVT